MLVNNLILLRSCFDAGDEPFHLLNFLSLKLFTGVERLLGQV